MTKKELQKLKEEHTPGISCKDCPFRQLTEPGQVKHPFYMEIQPCHSAPKFACVGHIDNNMAYDPLIHLDLIKLKWKSIPEVEKR